MNMKKCLTFLLSCFICCLGNMNLSVAQSQDIVEFAASDSVGFGQMLCLDNDELLVRASRYLMKFDSTGNCNKMVGMDLKTTSEHILKLSSKSDGSPIVFDLYRNDLKSDGSPVVFNLYRENDLDTAHMQLITVADDLSLTYYDFEWNEPYLYSHTNFNETHWIVNRDNSMFFAYIIDSTNNCIADNLKVVKFGEDGSWLNEVIIPIGLYDYQNFYNFNMIPTKDSLGFSLVMKYSKYQGQRFTRKCMTFDSEMNLVSIKPDVNELSHPYWCTDNSYLALNPKNGRTYSVTELTFNAFNNNPEHDADLLVSMWDENFNQMLWSCPIVPKRCNDGSSSKIIFDDDGGVYMIFEADIVDDPFFPKCLGIIYFDEDLNKQKEIYFRKSIYLNYHFKNGFCRSSSGDLMFSVFIRQPDSFSGTYYIMRVPKESFDSVEEAHTIGFTTALAYPNPGTNTLNIRTALHNSNVEVFDFKGRLVYHQAITDVVTTIDTSSWPSGTYIWRIFSDGKETETGKWTKE